MTRVIGLIIAVITSGCLSASTIPVGYFSFAVDAPLPGQSSFTFVNATGPIYGCLTEAPVCDELDVSGTLTVRYSATEPVDILLSPAVGPGIFLPPNFILDDTRVPLSASFLGTIGLSSLLLSDGQMFATSGVVSGSVEDLASTAELILFAEPAEVTAIPEPASRATGAAGLAIVAILAWLRHASR